jgi:hypothetical protein
VACGSFRIEIVGSEMPLSLRRRGASQRPFLGFFAPFADPDRSYCRQGEPSQLFKRGINMGANFQTMTLPGTTSRSEVTRTFSEAQDQDRSQNGSQYSGGFGMCSGLILSDYNFHIRRTAESYLMGRSQKWDHALAVKYDTGEGQNWLIGAWCAE